MYAREKFVGLEHTKLRGNDTKSVQGRPAGQPGNATVRFSFSVCVHE